MTALAVTFSLVPASVAGAVEPVAKAGIDSRFAEEDPIDSGSSEVENPADVQGIDPVDGVTLKDNPDPTGIAPMMAPPQSQPEAQGPQIPTLFLWGDDSEYAAVLNDKDYKSPNWSAAITDPTDPSMNIAITESVELKGRGNYTWCTEDNGRGGQACNTKLPYQVKFPSKVNVLGLGESKTWVLLANYTDASLMRNKLAFDFGKDIGLAFTPDATWVDLQINGKKFGNYLLTEKVEPGNDRVKFNTKQGIIAELDNNYGTSENFYFQTGTSNSVVTLKDAADGDKLADGCTEQPGMSDSCLKSTDTRAGWVAMKSKLNQLDAELRKSSPSWSAIESLIDVDSFARYFFLYDVFENPELVKSSVYFYMDGPNDKIHAGPAWDFDSAAFNYENSEPLGGNPKADYAKTTYMLRYSGSSTHRENPWYFDLYRNPEFVDYTNQLWKSEIGSKVDALVGEINSHEALLKESAATNFTVYTNVLGKPTKLIPGIGHDNESKWGGTNSVVSWLRGQVEKRVAFLKTSYGNIPLLQYQAQVQNEGWTNSLSRGKVNNGQVSGTIMKNQRLEALKISLPSNLAAQGWCGTGAIEARAHVQNVGWQAWQSASRGGSLTIGTEGKGLRMEAFEVRLTGGLQTNFSVEYRAHVQDKGWMSWVKSGATAGTSGQGLRVEAVQIRLIAKNPSAALPTDCSGTPVNGVYQNYPDVLDTHQFATEINWLADNGVSDVAKGEKYRPVSKTTRAETAQMLYNDAKRRGIDSAVNWVAPGTSPFTDVTPSTPRYEAITWLAAEGITTGWPDNTFRPGNNVERGAIAAFFYRYAGSPSFTPTGKVFKDVSTSNQFFTEIDWMTSTEITLGWADNTFRPLENTDRGAMAAFIYRLNGVWEPGVTMMRSSTAPLETPDATQEGAPSEDVPAESEDSSGTEPSAPADEAPASTPSEGGATEEGAADEG